jgi:hypothetical protein
MSDSNPDAVTGVVTSNRAGHILKLAPVMASLQRGQMLFDTVILEVTGLPYGKLDGQIRKWFLDHGIVIKHRLGDDRGGGYYLLTDAEQSTPHIGHQLGHAVRRVAKTARAGAAVDVSKLTQKQREAHDRSMELLSRTGQSLSGAMSEHKYILTGGAANRAPGGSLPPGPMPADDEEDNGR